jgi:hypothetical protein
MGAYDKKALLLLKVGVAFAFLYPAFSAFSDPSLWIGYVPSWIEMFMPREIFLPIFSTIEILVALGVLFLNKALPSIVAGIMLVSIVSLIEVNSLLSFAISPSPSWPSH